MVPGTKWPGSRYLDIAIPSNNKRARGRPSDVTATEQRGNRVQLFFLGELFYFAGLSLVKISILFFFYRMFPVRNLQNIMIFIMALCAGYGICFFVATLFQCRPISKGFLSAAQTTC